MQARHASKALHQAQRAGLGAEPVARIAGYIVLEGEFAGA